MTKIKQEIFDDIRDMKALIERKKISTHGERREHHRPHTTLVYRETIFEKFLHFVGLM